LDTGTLYLVATPVGNLEDITLRAIRILGEVDIIAAEDTRRTLKLLNHFNIKKPLVSYYEYNKHDKGKYLMLQLKSGKNIALVSDAGTPGISDPGEDLVRLAVENGINVTMAPGPAAVIEGIVLSGLPTGRFAFEGFLSMDKRMRKERLNSIKEETRTMVFYEAPHKLINTLKDMHDTLGNRRIALARELTKKFEEVLRCTLEDAIKMYEDKQPKGEYVLVIEGMNEEELGESRRIAWNQLSLEEHMNLYMEKGFSKKDAIKKVAKERGISKREVYTSSIKE
jgi:16S rRNA (cytidine1402-2'-O)-methyltransferase